MKPIDQISVQFMSRSVNEGFARGVVSAFLARADPTVEQLIDVKTAVSEAVTNAIVHGYPGHLGPVKLTLAFYETGLVKITVADKGCGIEDVQKLLKQEFYYVIPNDFQAASQSIIDGKPLVLEHQDIALSDAIRVLVGLYSNRSLGGVEEPVRGEHKSSLFGRLFG